MKKFFLKDWILLKSIQKTYFIIAGIIALFWFLVRVIPKPSRASYPCQRLAFPIASGFIIWMSVNILSFISIKKLAGYYNKKGKTIALISCIAMVIFYFTWLTSFPGKNMFTLNAKTLTNESFTPIDSVNSPVGIARGIFPGRVVWVHDTSATGWNGSYGHWWDDNNTDQATVSDMFSRSIQQITGKQNDVAAWDTLFKFFNFKHGKGYTGYKPGEKIAIKLSLVQSTDPASNGANNNFSTPQTVLALLRQLVYNAGVIDSCISFYDATRSCIHTEFRR